jgi:hypothetical protein
VLDFSHLRAKGIEIRSSPQCTRSVHRGAYLPPTDHVMRRLLAPFTPLLSKRLWNTSLGSFEGDFLRIVVGDRHGESPKDVRRMTNLCGVLHGQMAKVKLKKQSEKGYEHRSDRGFGRCTEAEMERKASLAARRTTRGCVRDFSDSFGRKILRSAHLAHSPARPRKLPRRVLRGAGSRGGVGCSEDR